MVDENYDRSTAGLDTGKARRNAGLPAFGQRDLGVTSIRNLTSSVHDYKGLSGIGIEIVSSGQFEGGSVK